MYNSLYKYYPLDVFLISQVHPHTTGSPSSALMDHLDHYHAVRSTGVIKDNRREGYEQVIEFIRAGQINTLFIDPGYETKKIAIAAEYIDNIRKEFPDVVIVIYLTDSQFINFIQTYSHLSHYFHMNWLRSNGNDSPYFSKDQQSLNIVLEQCQKWFATRYEYDIALSFSGDDRPFAEELANILKANGARVFYDRDEQADLLGKNLYESLYEIYCNKCRYCVLLSSKSYSQKMWTSHERQAAQERALNDRGKNYILPIRIDNTKIHALSSNIAYLEASLGAEQIAEIITKKLWVFEEYQHKKYIGRSLY